MRLAGRTAVVTGAAGGIGSAAARAFAAEGAAVGLLDLASPALDALAAQLGGAARPLPADVRDEEQVRAALAGFDRLDVLYTCAGVQLHGADGPAERVDLETWLETLRTNLTGTFLPVKHALPLLRAGGGGSVILCGSPTALTMSGAGYTAYAASKGGVLGMARVLAADYADDGIRVNVVVPGTIRTPLVEELLTDPAVRGRLLAGTPGGRLGTPEDLTGIAVFLASPESAYATGGVFTVDGGLTAR